MLGLDGKGEPAAPIVGVDGDGPARLTTSMLSCELLRSPPRQRGLHRPARARDGGCCVLVAVVDHVRAPAAVASAQLGGAGDGCDDGGTSPARELNDGMTHCSSAATSTTLPVSAPGCAAWVRLLTPVVCGVLSLLVRQGWRRCRSSCLREGVRPGPQAFVYSCAVPVGCGRRDTQTGSPTARCSTPSPSASTTPAPSWFGVTSGNGGAAPSPEPRRDFQSVGLTPETTMWTRTSPGPVRSDRDRRAADRRPPYASRRQISCTRQPRHLVDHS